MATTMKKTKNGRSKKTLEELQEIARVATREALRDFPELRRFLPDLVLGVIIDGDDRVFELYIPGDRPEDACVISSVRVNSYSGESALEIFQENIKNIRFS